MNKMLTQTVLTGVSLLAMAASIQAQVITSNLDQISSPTIGSGTLGTVTLTQNGANEVDVAVALAGSTAFVSTGGPHNAFVFNDNLTSAFNVAITSPTGGFFALGGTGVSNTPFGTFSIGIDCPGCGPGASNANSGPLDFTVTDSSGISVSNLFQQNSSGNYFSADVIGPAGGTGNIAANSGTLQAPEMDSSTAAGGLTLLLGGLAVLRGRRRS